MWTVSQMCPRELDESKYSIKQYKIVCLHSCVSIGELAVQTAWFTAQALKSPCGPTVEAPGVEVGGDDPLHLLALTLLHSGPLGFGLPYSLRCLLWSGLKSELAVHI